MRFFGFIGLYAQLLPAAACWVGLLWLTTTLYPDQPRVLETFFVLLFGALAATVGSLVWVLGRLPRARVGPHSALTAFAHGSVFSALALFGLWLQSLRLLTPIHAILLVGLYLFFELALAFGGRRA
jgi:hypothetical protein